MYFTFVNSKSIWSLFDLIYLRPDRNDVRISNLILYWSMKKKIQSIFLPLLELFSQTHIIL